MSNPIIPLLIVGMSFCFVVICLLLFIVRKCLVHYMDSEREDYHGR